jgi:uncharacterized membrane protein (UPF0127 family)
VTRRAHFLHGVSPSGEARLITAAGRLVAGRVTIAGDSSSRRQGLLRLDGLSPDAALILAPCAAIHTFGMRFAIDVVFAGRDGRVLRISRSVFPRRIAVCLRAFAAVELAAGRADQVGLSLGDVLRLDLNPPAGDAASTR